MAISHINGIKNLVPGLVSIYISRINSKIQTRFWFGFTNQNPNDSKPPNWVPAQQRWQHDNPNIYASGWMLCHFTVCQRTRWFTRGFYDHELGGERGVGRGSGGLSLFVPSWYSLLPRSQISLSKLKWFFRFSISVFFFPQQSFFVFFDKLWGILEFFSS